MNNNVLKQWIEQSESQPAPGVTHSFCVTTKSVGHYRVEEQAHRVGTIPPARFEFVSDNYDVIVIWSVNPFLSEATAHEIATLMGEKLGIYV